MAGNDDGYGVSADSAAHGAHDARGQIRASAERIDQRAGVHVERDGVDREVNFFRVGRVALLYQTTDTEISGAWDKESKSFVQLDKGEYRNAILKGLRIARKQASIDILKIPVSAPEAAK